MKKRHEITAWEEQAFNAIADGVTLNEFVSHASYCNRRLARAAYVRAFENWLNRRAHLEEIRIKIAELSNLCNATMLFTQATQRGEKW